MTLTMAFITWVMNGMDMNTMQQLAEKRIYTTSNPST